MPITIIHAGQRQIFDTGAPSAKSAPAGDKPCTLARFLWLERRLPPRPLCNGVGHCGRCRVLFRSPPPEPTPSELRLLSDEERKAGVRLACRHFVEDGLELEIDYDPSSPSPNLVGKQKSWSSPAGVPSTQSERQTFPTSEPKASRTLRLAVDLGTTSVVWQAEDPDGNILAAGQTLNPQMSAGSDVMSRLAEGVVPEGAELLRSAIIDFLQSLVANLQNEGWSISEICLAANPAMTALALGFDTTGLKAAPYRLPPDLASPGGREVAAPDLPPLWIPPQIAPFVGGDMSAGLVTLLNAPRPFLLADLGTNGEFILATGISGNVAGTKESEAFPSLFTASVPLGPALEGMGMLCGGLAEPGGITAFHLGPGGLEAVTFDGGQPRHICGTGYLSLLRCLCGIGLIDATGSFVTVPLPYPGPLDFLRRRLAASLRPHSATGENVLPLPGRLFLSAGDVENLLQVKAAFSLAVERLLTEAALSPKDLNRVYLAGALGAHAPLDALEELGFLPSGVAAEAVGNSSLQGAALLLRDKSMRPRLERAISSRRVLELTSDPRFHQDFIRHMRFTSAELPL